MRHQKTLAFILGGGKGDRLQPLTRDRAKPAVPFLGTYRIIDFVLSNMYHSGIRRICVLTQYEPESLHRHIKYGWYPLFGQGREEFLDVLPARLGSNGYGWYKATADAVTQNMDVIKDNNPALVNVFGADHIYFMDVAQMNEFHLENDADLTISALPVHKDFAKKRLGVLVIDADGKLQGFQEKPEDPASMPGYPEYCLASMGNYTFNAPTLMDELGLDHAKMTATKEEALKDPEKLSTHDFGTDVIPAMLRRGRRIFAYNFRDNVVPGQSQAERGFWEDVGKIDDYWSVSMQMCSSLPPLNLYNPEWEVLTSVESMQPAKIVGGDFGECILGNGVIVSRSHLERSALGYNVKVEEGSHITDSIMLGNIITGKGVRISRSIIDRNVNIPTGTVIGDEKEQDRSRGFTVSEGGITVVPRNYQFS